jgi:hypothetical protein
MTEPTNTLCEDVNPIDNCEARNDCILAASEQHNKKRCVSKSARRTDETLVLSPKKFLRGGRKKNKKRKVSNKNKKTRKVSKKKRKSKNKRNK